MTFRESDPLMVLGGRESRSQGDAVDRGSQPAKETGAGHDGPGKRLPTSLRGIADKARRAPKHRFRNLYGMLNEAYLHECWRWVRKNAASGVDRVSAREYERDLTANIQALVERLKQKRYRARLVRRHWIPKGTGDKLRPLGIPVVEDKLLQVAVARILTAMFEPDFLRCSYGYRPKVGALDAVDKLTVKLQFGEYHHVVEVDLENYFGTIDHDWLVTMLEQRIDDRPFLRLIRKWLKAGVLETDGRVIHPTTGTPQGGVVTPPTQRAISSSRLTCPTGGGSGPTAEGDIKGSIVVTSMIFLWHGRRSSSESRPSGAAPQHGRGAAGLRRECRGGQPAARRSAPNLGEASPEVRRAGARPGPRGGAARQGGLHREAPDRSGPAGPAAGRAPRADDQCLGRFGVDGVPGAAASRLSRWMIDASSSSTSWIVSARRTWRKPTGCSFPSVGG